MIRRQDRAVLAALAGCSLSQHMPLIFLLIAAPALLREAGMPVEKVGLVGTVFLPFAFQFVWAPALDRWQIDQLGRWRGWLLVTQFAGACGLLGLSLLSPQSNFPAFLASALLLSFIAGTQKIALGGYAIEALAPEARPAANAALGAGAAAGTAVGTIGLLSIFEHWGWTPTFLAAAMLAGVLSLPILLLKAPAAAGSRQPATLRGLLRLPNGGGLLLQAAALGVPLGGCFGLLQPWLVDSGMSLAAVGWINGGAYLGVWLLAGPLAALVAGRSTSEAGIVLALAAAACAGALLAAANALAPGIAFPAVAAAMAVYAAMCFAFVRLYTTFMAASRSGRSATDFNALVCSFTLVMLCAGPLAAQLAGKFGYTAAFAAICLWAGAALAFRVLHRTVARGRSLA